MNFQFLHSHAHAEGFWPQIGEAAWHSLKDSLWSLPVLFIAYLLMELLERSKRLNESILHSYSRKAGPALGGILGVIPQCGISGAAATLFSTGSISVGTMLAVFFATSDEMLPVMLSSLSEGKGLTVGSILLILLVKAGMGILLGYAADGVLNRWIRSHKDIHGFCHREHCDCDDDEGNVFLAALKHTIKIILMLFVVTFILELLFQFIGVERLSGTILSKPVLGEAIVGLFGLIPNCSVSVIITESYLSGVISLGAMFAGLFANGGIGLLVLFRNNRNLKENLAITAVLYGLSVLASVLIGFAATVF